MNRGEELKDKFLQMEGTIKDEKIKKRTPSKAETHRQRPRTAKIYRDNYRIYRVGTIYSSDFIIQMIYDEGSYTTFNLLRPGSREIPISSRDKNYLRARLNVRFQCCYAGIPANDPVEVTIEIIDSYTNEAGMPDIDAWISYTGINATERIANDECSDWNDTYDPCPGSIEILNIIEKERVIAKPRIPEAAISLYKELKSEIERERRRADRLTDEIADILTTPREELTTEQRREIRRLDSEIRRSNEIIREDEREMRDLESRFPGIERM